MLIMFKKLLNIGKGHQNHKHHPSSTTTGSEKPTSSSTSMLSTVDDLNGSTASGSIIVRNNGTSTPAANLTVNGPEVSQFVRTAQNRMSLPIMQQNKARRQAAYSHLQRRGQHIMQQQQHQQRSLGYIYLQHKGETKQACLPNELTTIDTIRALFVCAFPHFLTMEYMSQPFVKIYIYNPSCNIFYELCDIEDVKHESVLRIHQSDPMSLAMAPIPIGHPMQQPQNVSMASIQSHYATLNRLSSTRALPPQVPAPPPPQQQQQQPPPPPPHPQQMPPHLMQPATPMMNSTFQQRLTPNHHHQQQVSRTSFHNLPPQIPPPKPRRMIPANFAMHRIQPQSQ